MREQEADRVADQVMRMAAPAPPPAATISTRTQRATIQRSSKTCEEEQTIKLKEVPDRTPEVTPAVQAQVNALRNGGQPLPESVRSLFEPRFGCDFGQVRVHTDARAAEAARVVKARAFTLGGDIVFAARQYAPSTASGMHLLVHELTHVAQQRGQLFRTSGGNGYRPTPSPIPPGRLMRAISYDPDCQPNQKDVESNVSRAQASAARWTQSALANLPIPKEVSSLLRRHFNIRAADTAAVARTRNSFEAIAGYLEGDAFTYHCRPDSDPRCHSADGREFAGFAYPGQFDIDFCLPYPFQNVFGHTSLIETLLHEAAHAHDTTFYHDTYESGSAYPGPNPLTNADSYATFATDAALGRPGPTLELTVGGLVAAGPQFHIAAGFSSQVGGPALDVFNLKAGLRVGFTPRAGQQPTRLFEAVDIGPRINPIRQRLSIDLTTGAFVGANFTDTTRVAGIANRPTAGYRGESVDLGLDLSHPSDLVARENLAIVGVRGAASF